MQSCLAVGPVELGSGRIFFAFPSSSYRRQEWHEGLTRIQNLVKITAYLPHKLRWYVASLIMRRSHRRDKFSGSKGTEWWVAARFALTHSNVALVIHQVPVPLMYKLYVCRYVIAVFVSTHHVRAYTNGYGALVELEVYLTFDISEYQTERYASVRQTLLANPRITQGSLKSIWICLIMVIRFSVECNKCLSAIIRYQHILWVNGS